MKYGESLRQRSIPAWSHHNIDYDDIKRYIKEQTTPSNGKTIAVQERNDEKLVRVERSLFGTLSEQHHRIDLFVKSKAGEIQRRLDHSKRQFRQLSARSTPAVDGRIPVSRLERYGRLENDVLKAGDEIKYLARFSSAQRDGFRKLLKKYKKWTGSTQLEDRFREEVLNDPKSFTKLDLDRTPSSAASMNNLTDSATAVETTRSDSVTQPSDPEVPPLKSFRKKRRRGYPETVAPQQARYWSEYDNPEEEDERSTYVIYIDPNAKSSFDMFFDWLGAIFGRRRQAEKQALLAEPSSPRDDESSSEEDNVVTGPRDRSYGTITPSLQALEAQRHLLSLKSLPPSFTAITFVASLTILIIAYVLAATGKQKLKYQVDFGVILAVSSSLFFAIAGFTSLLRRSEVSYPAWIVGVLVLVVDAIGSGGLLAWMFG
ncbi:hypothetical protein BAUCODRAFT_68129 [Baudoinia panamericana UAMH 10762]|uniref:SPX domain-containing protein n=1 Tax=Baudoinia panamericana (strain UAMH 10762) TaxID=717646 RepID=M2MKH5_BAUPA|nr:uncharacterized protein BAUCODRAFT_68129 [Baudoinia panamericana UAMH 10762]EMC97196.1 hypothetical protein BAUCODRAFT_68129 [Baudoinia panamericana UAMH 10762]